MASVLPRLLIPAAALALFASPAVAQRPALTGEKARVAEAVKADLTKLSESQKAHHTRSKVYAADLRDLNFTPTSGAQVNIAYASMNAWAANATHPVLSPIACFIIISAAEPTGPAAEPFCQEGRPGTTVATAAPTTTPSPAAPATTPARTTPAPSTSAPSTSRSTPDPVTTPATPRQGSQQAPAQAAPSNPPARTETTMTPATPAAPLRQRAAPASAEAGPAGRSTFGQDFSAIPTSALSLTRETDPAGAIVSQQAETVTAAEFSKRLGEFAQGANAIFMTQPADLVRVVRDPYESTDEFEARRAAAIAAAERREQEFFQQNNKTYVVTLPIRDVRYDADREVLEFTVDGIGLPITRTFGDDSGTPTLAFTCYSRPVFWCSPESGMTYEAGDLWRVPRATARQYDVLRTPLVLNARFAVGRRQDSRTLSISLLSMDLQARGQSVQRWDGAR